MDRFKKYSLRIIKGKIKKEGDAIIRKNIFFLINILIIVFIIGLLFLTVSSQTINVKDYIKDKFPSVFSFYLSSLEDLDSYEKEFIDLLEKLPGEEQGYYAKEVYKNGFSLELLEKLKKGKIFEEPTLDWNKIKEKYEATKEKDEESVVKTEEKPIESLPSLIKRIKPSTVIIFVYDDKGEFLKLGSGFFISQNGDVITNYHVLQGASSAEIKTSDEKTYPITYILAGDEQDDLIRLSVNIPSQDVYPLSLSQTIPEVGERIIVYGSPLGLENTVSDGIVSAIRDIPDYGKIIQITAPISPGSSGSPVLNMQGEVIGIASFQMVEGQNLNFAIPSEKITSLILTEENKISIPEEVFGPESKAKKDSDYDKAYQKALYFIDKKEYEKALPYLEIAIKTDISPLKERAYFRIGYCNAELGNYIKAIEAYKQVIHINPNDASTYYNLGNAYYNLGLDKDAIEAYKQAIRIDPNDASVYYNLGAAYGQIGLHKEAIEVYKQAIRIDPDYVKAHFNLGLSYLIIGDKSSALNEYKILKELDIDMANVLFDLIY
jgi:S1-C subfamily serine protease/Flp pilus assembly protein TadD